MILNGDLEPDHRPPSWLIIGIIAIISTLLISCFVIYYVFPTDCDFDQDYIKMDQEKFEDGWLLKITESHKAYEEGDSGFSLEMKYYLTDYPPTNMTDGRIQDINGKFNDDGTIIFFDIDDNNLLNKGDIFIIMGNSVSQIKPGYEFSVWSGSIELR